ncbi:MAG TPA: hypothetical protein VLJ39_06495, partial [Tepidisphaeraceae bacterium]|nr:hypothetical protein [Tepidisphaeraceae bacterium]
MSNRINFFLVALLIAVPASAEQFVQPLISASRNLNIESMTLMGQKITPACPVAWSVQKGRLHGGKQEGVDVIRLDNGKMQFLIIPTRGMGVLS